MMTMVLMMMTLMGGAEGRRVDERESECYDKQRGIETSSSLLILVSPLPLLAQASTQKLLDPGPRPVIFLPPGAARSPATTPNKSMRIAPPNP